MANSKNGVYVELIFQLFGWTILLIMLKPGVFCCAFIWLMGLISAPERVCNPRVNDHFYSINVPFYHHYPPLLMLGGLILKEEGYFSLHNKLYNCTVLFWLNFYLLNNFSGCAKLILANVWAALSLFPLQSGIANALKSSYLSLYSVHLCCERTATLYTAIDYVMVGFL